MAVYLESSFFCGELKAQKLLNIITSVDLSQQAVHNTSAVIRLILHFFKPNLPIVKSIQGDHE